MELIDKLEEHFERLAQRIRRLEEENQSLRGDLEKIKIDRSQVLDRVDRLLKKMQEVDID
jgi:phage shock protein A